MYEYLTFSRYIPYIKTDILQALSPHDYTVVDKIIEKYSDKKFRFRQERFLSKKATTRTDFIYDIQSVRSLYILPNQKVFPAWNLTDYEL
jgi:hypothetical protein